MQASFAIQTSGSGTAALLPAEPQVSHGYECIVVIVVITFGLTVQGGIRIVGKGGRFGCNTKTMDEWSSDNWLFVFQSSEKKERKQIKPRDPTPFEGMEV